MIRQNKKIWIVEDESIIALTIESALKSLGFEVLGIDSSGEQCLVSLQNNSPDLILMDIRLAGKLDGIETADEIRNKYFIPIIFLTAYSNPELLDRAVKSNPYGYIVKPFHERDLLSNIELALYKHAYEKKLVESENKFKNIVNTIVEGILQIDLIGNTVQFVNEKFCEMTEVNSEEVVGKNIYESLYFFSQHKEKLTNIENGWFEGLSGKQELNFITKSGQEKCFFISSAPVKDDYGKNVSSLSLWLDITEKKKQENQLKKFYYTIEQSEELILITNRQGCIEYANPTFCKVTGYSLNEIIGQFPQILKSEKHSKIFYKELWNTITSGRAFSVELINKKKNGSLYHEEKIISPLFNENGEIINFLSTGRDVTEKKQNQKKIEAYKKLQELTEKKQARIRTLSLIQGQEEERKRISRDLHDGLGQILSATKINLERLEIRYENKDLQRVYSLVVDTIQEIRKISNDLSPATLHDFGLLSAVNNLASNLNEAQNQFVVYLNSNISNRRFKSDLEINIYRIIQESINNAIKHSKCTKIEVNINLFENNLKISIRDNGIGFIPAINNDYTGEIKSLGGLKNIQERASIVGGEINILSDIGVGTLISFQIDSKNYK